MSKILLKKSKVNRSKSNILHAVQFSEFSFSNSLLQTNRKNERKRSSTRKDQREGEGSSAIVEVKLKSELRIIAEEEEEEEASTGKGEIYEN